MECELLQLPDYLTPGLLDFEFDNSPFSVCTKFTFKKEKLAKKDLFDDSDSHENFFLNRCAIKHYAIFSGHIGDGHREIQEIGAHRRDLKTLTGVTGSVKNICCRS